jgi:serine/threonine protein kinase
MSHIHNQILPEGTQLGVYEIKEASKIDTFDITYRAWNHHLKEWVEIREYFPHDFAIRANDAVGVEPKSPIDKENFDYGLKAFLDQAEILTQIEHPNIVKAENVLQFNGTAYLIMDCQDGAPLSKLVRSPASFAETELKFILVSILNALQKVHEHKIVHGGIQPAAIILGKDGEPLLTDFAVARLAIAAHTAKLADELPPGYAPPELYGPANKSGPASDFYALGATIYYCITHNHPTAAQSRIMALSKGEPDPMVSLSGSPGTTYSAEMMQAIDWMLRPEYNDRPHSAIEILALLKSGPINEQAGQITSRQESEDFANSSPIVKNPVWIGVMVGLVVLVVVGLWFAKKPAEIIGDKASTVISGTNVNQPIALSTDKSSEESDPDKISEHTKNEIKEPEKQPKQADEDVRQITSADDNQAKNRMMAESVPFPASKSVSKPALKDKITSEQESVGSQQLAVIDKSQLEAKKQDLPEQPSDKGIIKGHLAAAKKAMKAVRLTTPLRDNAYKHYQMVLAIEPGNAEALAGLQKIVDRYVWFIQKARAEGKLNTAKRALLKAESVLPDDPKLQSIRAELAATKE